MESNKKTFDFHEIKTFEDACQRLGISKETFLTLANTGDTESFSQTNARYRLLIIQKAMNNGKLCDKDGWSYVPYCARYPKELVERMSQYGKNELLIKQICFCSKLTFVGICVAKVYNRNDELCVGYNPPFFNSEEAALYAAKQFEDLFFKFYGIKVKE